MTNWPWWARTAGIYTIGKGVWSERSPLI